MLKRLHFIPFALCLVMMPLLPGRADEITAAMRKADPRLQTRVTLRSPHILMGELLERLSKQSGVPITTDDESATGGDAVAVSLPGVPLADAMDALWSLFSYRHAEWDWRRSPVKGAEGKGAKGKYVYRLTRPDYARFQAKRLKEQVQADFEAQAQELLNALNMPSDQLKEAAKHDFLLNSMVVDGRVEPGIRVLAGLPPGALTALLRGGPPITMAVSQLPPHSKQALQEARAWLAAEFARQGTSEEMIKGSLPEPTQIGIVVTRNPDQVAPGLYIDTGQGSGDYFGGGYMEDPWRQKMNANWMQPKDAAEDPASARALAAPKQPPTASGKPHALADYLLLSSKAAQVPLMARLPHDLDETINVGTISQLPAAKTIGALLEGVGKRPVNLQHKWRGGVLLLTCQNWFMDESEDSRLPWAEAQRLRDAEAAGDGFLSLGELAHAAAVLNVAQMHRLGAWFPVLNNAADWHDFLAFYDKTPEYRARVLSAKGDAFEYPESLVSPPLAVEALRAAHPNLRLRVQEKLNVGAKPPTRELMFELLDDAGTHMIGGQGFGYTAREYQASLQVDEGTSAVGSKTGPAK